MPKFNSGYSSKSNLVDNDKFLISDSQASDAIKSATKAAVEAALSGGTLADTKYFTASGTWTKPAKLKYIIVSNLLRRRLFRLQAGGFR